jgi:chromosome segregation ATPase
MNTRQERPNVTENVWDTINIDALVALLQQAKAQAAIYQASRGALEDALRGAKAALASATERHEHLLGQWATEHDALVARLEQAKTQAASQQADRRALEDALRGAKAALASATERHEQLRGQWATEHDALVARLEQAKTQAASQQADRRALEDALRDARAANEALARNAAVATQGHAEALRAAEERGLARADKLISDCRSLEAALHESLKALRAVESRGPQQPAEGQPAEEKRAVAEIGKPQTGRLDEWAREGVALRARMQAAEERWRLASAPRTSEDH